MTIEEALNAALDDEYRARATYRAVLNAFGEVRPFANIIESEERHIAALKRLYDAHGITPPADPWMGRVEAPATLEAACQAGVDGERENAELYERLLVAAREHPDVEETFHRLLRASQQNHLPAFERCMRRGLPSSMNHDESGRGPQRRRQRYRGGRD